MFESIHFSALAESEISESLFARFNRYQDVKKCWRKENGKWVLKDVVFTERWGPDEHRKLTEYLKNTAKTGGALFAAFDGGLLVGFASIESGLFGSQKEYLELSSIHTSYEYRGTGIGKKLFSLVCEKAIEMGAKKLYISAHSSQETQAFYATMGCVEALEYNDGLVAKEPCDCQLEYRLPT